MLKHLSNQECEDAEDRPYKYLEYSRVLDILHDFWVWRMTANRSRELEVHGTWPNEAFDKLLPRLDMYTGQSVTLSAVPLQRSRPLRGDGQGQRRREAQIQVVASREHHQAIRHLQTRQQIKPQQKHREGSTAAATI